MTHDREYVRNEVQRLGRIVGARDADLPEFGRTLRDAHPFIEIDATTYHYVFEERGREIDRFSTASLDELLYRVCCDMTFSLSVAYELAHRIPGQDARRLMFERQVALLGRVKLEWAARQALEHAAILERHPFTDRLGS
jgi:hypothetical protein